RAGCHAGRRGSGARADPVPAQCQGAAGGPFADQSGEGLKRLFSADSLVEAVKSVAKIAVLAIVAWRVLRGDLPSLLLALLSEPAQLLSRAAGPVLHILLVVLAAQAGIATLDLFWVLLRH